MTTLMSTCTSASIYTSFLRTLRTLQQCALAPPPPPNLTHRTSLSRIFRLPGFLIGWDARLPLLFAHIWYGPEARNSDEGAWPSGGAGIILSRRAAELLAANLYTKKCPFLQLNDVTIGHCATVLRIPMIHSPVFDPEGNVMVAETRNVKRLQRKDGSLVRPASCFSEGWVPKGTDPAPFSQAELFTPSGEKVSEENLTARFGRPDEWQEVIEAVVVRRPLKDVYKTRTAVDTPLFLHRAKPLVMLDIHLNYTRSVRDWLDIDTQLGRLGVDTIEDAQVKLGIVKKIAPEDLALMTETTTTFKV